MTGVAAGPDQAAAAGLNGAFRSDRAQALVQSCTPRAPLPDSARSALVAARYSNHPSRLPRSGAAPAPHASIPYQRKCRSGPDGIGPVNGVGRRSPVKRRLQQGSRPSKNHRKTRREAGSR